MGGLGNQLFCIAAAYSLAATSRQPLTLWESDYLSGGSLAGLDLEMLGVNHILPVQRYPDAARHRQVSYLARSIMRFFPQFADELMGPVSAGQLLFEKTVGAMEVSGYFQSAAVAQQACSLGWPTTVPLADTAVLGRPLDLELPAPTSVAVHVRQGDYRLRRNRRRIGLLHPNYYRVALARLREMMEVKDIVLFSDDSDRAIDYLGGAGVRVDAVVCSREKLGAGRDLALMSRFPAIVIPNSTFSWWAAFWAEPGAHIVYPHPWNRKPLGVELNMTTWTAADAQFL